MAERRIPSVDTLKKRYPGNSHAQRDAQLSSDIQERPQVKQVAKAKTRKQGLFTKFASYILEDTVETARERALSDIIRPGIKSLLYDTGIELLSTVIYGNSETPPRGSQRPSMRRTIDRTSYTSYYNQPARKNDSRAPYRERTVEPDDIILDTYQEANNVLRELDDYIFTYGRASIADLYDCVGLSCDWPDHRYGWFSMRGATIRPVREGYMIIMPPTVLLTD